MSAEPVRCHACGGVFEEKARVCSYCNAGVRFAGLGLAAKPTSLPCPRCAQESTLFEVGYRGVQIDVCPRCEGSWYDMGELDLIVRSSREGGQSGSFSPSKPALGLTPDEGGAHDDVLRPVYIRCPHCDKVMGRKNWEKRSGIIVDWCNDHGFWLDGGELQRIRTWSAQNPDGPPPPLPEPPREISRSSDSGGMSLLTSTDHGWRGGTPRLLVEGGGWIIWFLGRMFLGR